MPHVTVHAFHRITLHYPHPTVYLHCAVSHAPYHFRTIQFADTGCGAHIHAGIDLPQRLIDHKARSRNIHFRIGQHPLNGLPLGQRFAKRNTGFGMLRRHFQQAVRRADARTAHRHAPIAQRFLRQIKTLPRLAQHGAVRHFASVEFNLSELDHVRAHGGIDTRDIEPWRATIHQKRRDAATCTFHRIGNRNQCNEIGVVRAVDVMLTAIDHPTTVNFVRACGHRRVIRAARRLSQRKCCALAAVHQPGQILAALFGRAMPRYRYRRQPPAAAGQQTKHTMRAAEFFQRNAIRKHAHARAAHLHRQAH